MSEKANEKTERKKNSQKLKSILLKFSFLMIYSTKWHSWGFKDSEGNKIQN